MPPEGGARVVAIQKRIWRPRGKVPARNRDRSTTLRGQSRDLGAALRGLEIIPANSRGMGKKRFDGF
jgi:hypothetical protein